MNKEELQDKIIENILGTEQSGIWDKLTATDDDYMMYSPLPVGYNTTSEQRFLMQNLLLGFNASSILDIGCGRADLYGFIRDFYGENIIYHGIDHNPIMIDLAKQKYDVTCLTGQFESTELPIVDHVVANGVFTQRRCETEDDDLRKLLVDIDILYKTATNMVSFNLLNPINNTHHEGFFYVHPGLIMDMMIEKYQTVIVRNNYSKDVYTVIIYKI